MDIENHSYGAHAGFSVFDVAKGTSMTCYYCGCLLGEDRFSADDLGLHSDTRNNECCPKCHKLITTTNRELKMAMDDFNVVSKKVHIQQAILNLQEIIGDDPYM